MTETSPPAGTLSPFIRAVDGGEAPFDAFLEAVMERDLELYPAQEEAILEWYDGSHVFLATPTGSGKSLVALSAHFLAMSEGKRSFYTCPIKALVNEKFFSLCDEFGADNVGMLTGDVSINRDAPIICCTAEILANIAIRPWDDRTVDVVIMDEFHYYSDKERGVAWQIPLLTMPQTQFMLMSATMGKTQSLEASLTEHTTRPCSFITSHERPVPLDYRYSDIPLHRAVKELLEEGLSPIYIVGFTQRNCADRAQDMMSIDVSTKPEKAEIKALLKGTRFDSPYGKTISRFLHHGIGIHHAGLLPKYRLAVEKLAKRGLLKIICGTDTLGVGINIPLKTVLFTQLFKFNGENNAILSVRDFKQIAGRAGRRGFDTHGYVVSQAPEHVIENLQAERKVSANPTKKRKIVKKKPPERNFIMWDESTFERLQTSLSEPLTSQFKVSHGLLLNAIQNGTRAETRGYQRIVRLIRNSHDRNELQRRHIRHAAELVRSLREAGIVESKDYPKGGKQLVLREGIQDDFSLHQVLSLFAIQLADLILDTSPQPTLDLVSLFESVLENPHTILRQQVAHLKTQLMDEMKAAGVEYEERMERLSVVDHPKPLADFLYQHYNDFRRSHPWIAEHNVRPKSVAREMYEEFYSFNDYIRLYGLEKSEGQLLRYLSEFYKALQQTLPTNKRDEDLEECIAYFRGVLARVDSSLVQEWERRLTPTSESEGNDEAPEPTYYDQLMADRKKCAARVRTDAHTFLREFSNQRFDEASRMLGQQDDETQARLETLFKEMKNNEFIPFFGHRSRLSEYHQLKPTGPGQFEVTQTILGGDEDVGYAFKFSITLKPDLIPDEPILVLEEILEP
ncbi:MAG: DUF3516 domain-containing protein [Myxococcota bacterium]|nr:DUF3516 domain-containing protein [Myxococcota bacterium]